MSIVWPLTLPQTPLIDGFNQSFGDGRIKTPTDSGPGKRRATWKGLDHLNYTFNMTTGEWLFLKSFWEATCGYGVKPFFIPDPLSNGASLTTSSGEEITTTDEGTITAVIHYLVQFAEDSVPKLESSFTSNLHRVSMDLEVLP
jgi:hypothetical protein